MYPIRKIVLLGMFALMLPWAIAFSSSSSVSKYEDLNRGYNKLLGYISHDFEFHGSSDFFKRKQEVNSRVSKILRTDYKIPDPNSDGIYTYPQITLYLQQAFLSSAKQEIVTSTKMESEHIRSGKYSTITQKNTTLCSVNYVTQAMCQQADGYLSQVYEAWDAGQEWVYNERVANMLDGMQNFEKNSPIRLPVAGFDFTSVHSDDPLEQDVLDCFNAGRYRSEIGKCEDAWYRKVKANGKIIEITSYRGLGPDGSWQDIYDIPVYDPDVDAKARYKWMWENVSVAAPDGSTYGLFLEDGSSYLSDSDLVLATWFRLRGDLKSLFNQLKYRSDKLYRQWPGMWFGIDNVWDLCPSGYRIPKRNEFEDTMGILQKQGGNVDVLGLRYYQYFSSPSYVSVLEKKVEKNIACKIPNNKDCKATIKFVPNKKLNFDLQTFAPYWVDNGDKKYGIDFVDENGNIADGTGLQSLQKLGKILPFPNQANIRCIRAK